MKRKFVFVLILFLAASILTVVFLFPIFFPVSFPDASGTLTMRSRSNPKVVEGIDQYIDFSKMDDDTWAADAAGKNILAPYGLLYDVKTGELRLVKDHGALSGSGFAFDRRRQAYYGVLDDPQGDDHTICTFTLEEGQNEFPLEFRQGETLYSNKDAAVSSPLCVEDTLYFIEQARDSGGAFSEEQGLYRYHIKTQKKEKLATGKLILDYGIGASHTCYSAVTEQGTDTYLIPTEGEQKLLAKNAAIRGRSSNGQQVLIEYFGPEGSPSTIAVYDCEKDIFLAELDLKAPWGRFINGAISPDSRFLAAYFETKPERYQIRLIDLETSRQIPLFKTLKNFSAYPLDWS